MENLRGKIWLLAIAFLFLPGAPLGAQIPYFTNRAEAFQLASNDARTVIFYTGRAMFCPSNDPRAYFFDYILPKYPQLGTRSNAYVVWAQFFFSTNAGGGFTREFLPVKDLFTKHRIRSFVPTLTMLSPSGDKLNGPFARMASNPNDVSQFLAGSDDCYLSLREYAQANPPLTLAQAQSNAAAFFFATNQVKQPVGLFRSKYHPGGGQPKIFLQSGVESTSFEVGAPFQFRYRAGTTSRSDFSSGGFEETLVSLTGTLEDPPSFEGNFLLRMNDVYFHAAIKPVGNRPDRHKSGGGVAGEANEHTIVMYVRDDDMATALLNGLSAALKAEDAK